MDKDEHLKQLYGIFPGMEKEIIEIVYEQNSFSIELACNDLIAMSTQDSQESAKPPKPQPTTTPSSILKKSNASLVASPRNVTFTGHTTAAASIDDVPDDDDTRYFDNPAMTSQERQIMEDEKLAAILQEREAERYHHDEVARDISEKLGYGPSNSSINITIVENNLKFTII